MNQLEITEVKVWPIDSSKLHPDSKIRANCQITINDSLSVKAKVWFGKDGLWVGSEGQKVEVADRDNPSGPKVQKWFDAWKATSPDFQQLLTQAVLTKYNEVTGNTAAPQQNKSQVKTQENIPF
jgi:DNA-binding cell septation regulator SpoVG